MAEVLVRFTERIVAEDGTTYLPQVCGGVADDGLWEGWIEFTPESGHTLRTQRESEQPNRDALVYWAEGLTVIYLEGALKRALETGRADTRTEERALSRYSEPAPRHPASTAVPHAILDPFAAYSEGEELLRKQLGALSRDHLVNIVKAYHLPASMSYESMSDSSLVDSIVSAAQRANG
jgi:hypothetical protein